MYPDLFEKYNGENSDERASYWLADPVIGNSEGFVVGIIAGAPNHREASCSNVGTLLCMRLASNLSQVLCT